MAMAFGKKAGCISEPALFRPPLVARQQQSVEPAEL
jgi:hypothetical protein